MRKKILLTGGSGLIGSYFIQEYLNKFKGDQIIYPSHQQMDITDLDSLKSCFDLQNFEAVVHFAAFRNATLAEKQRGDRSGSVWKANVEGSRNIAKICKQYGSYLIHISTDYVFSGSKKNPGPYSEKDEPKDHERLLSWYGITKREAERAVLENFSNSSIIRICNITRPGNILELDYVGKILWLYNQKRIYPMFDDQFLTLTFIPTLVELIIKLLKVKQKGIYHVSTKNLTTPLKLADYLLEKMYGLKNTIKGISIDHFLRKNPRRYPKFGGLQAVLTQKKLGLEFTSWQETVDLFVDHAKKTF